MPSQLIDNQAISFIVAKPLKWRDHEYEMGDDFPQEEANNIETLVRSRFLIPVVDDINDKPRHWHREVQLRETVLAKLNNEIVQIVLPSAATEGTTEEEKSPPEPVSLPEDTTLPEVEPEAAAEAAHTSEYDPAYHTVTEVNDYLAAHPDERDAVIEKEQAGKNRKGIVEGY